MGVPDETVKVPECDCLKRPDASDPSKPLHVPGCPRMAAIRVKYGGAS